MMSPRQLTMAQCYVITASILLPVISGLVTGAAKDSTAAENNGSPTTASFVSGKSVIFESSSPKSYASRPSVLGALTTPGNPGNGSAVSKIKSFRELAGKPASSKAYGGEPGNKEPKVRRVNDSTQDSTVSHTDTPDAIWPTASHPDIELRSTETKQLIHSPQDSNSPRSQVKVTSGLETGSRTEFRQTPVLGGICCSTKEAQTATTTDNYDYNNYDDDDDENNDKNDDSDEGEKEIGDADSRDVAYGYRDRDDDSQTYDDYRGGMIESEDAEGGGSDESRTEYLYVSDNFTSNESQIASENQDLQQDSNSDYDDYNQSSDQSRDQSDNGQPIRAGLDYEAENRDYHLGVEHHNFDLHLGQKISAMRSGGHRGQTISLRWLEHHPINHFAVFLWLVAALALVSILLIAYRFRHAVIHAIQHTRANYKQGKRFGIEEANDLLSHAQV